MNSNLTNQYYTALIERAIVGSINIEPEHKIIADHLVYINGAESMFAAIICSMENKKNNIARQNRRTLILHNIPRDITVKDLHDAFEKYGPIRDIYIPRNKDDKSVYFGTIRGFAIVKFISSSSAEKAYDAEFGRLYLDFRLISISYAHEER